MRREIELILSRVVNGGNLQPFVSVGRDLGQGDCGVCCEVESSSMLVISCQSSAQVLLHFVNGLGTRVPVSKLIEVLQIVALSDPVHGVLAKSRPCESNCGAKGGDGRGRR